MDKIVIYTDGSAKGNGSQDSACGWAYKIIFNDGHVEMDSGGDKGKTNNQMEMIAVLNAMKAVKEDVPIEIYSDSKYVIETLNGNFSIKKNLGLWREIMAERSRFKDIKFIWIKGHEKNLNNIEVDRAAVKEAMKIESEKRTL